MIEKKLGIYIHVPFCKSKCFYCDFNSYCGKDQWIGKYFEALKREMALYREQLKEDTISTVYIGGGTPSYVELKHIEESLTWIKENLKLSKEAEISIESNPGTLNFNKLSAYFTLGINRISMGLQAWQDKHLKGLGRIHSAEELVKNYHEARKAGFQNINIDLIFGLPGQQIKDWEETLEKVIQLDPEHLSCYSLKIEEGTVFGEKLNKKEIELMEDELDREMYALAIQRLEENGYQHYEISNFSKKGSVSKHNLVYWKGEEYIGFGAGAHSYYQDVRFNNTQDIETYIGYLAKDALPVENKETIDVNEKMVEFMILGLRLVEGISVYEFSKKFNKEIFEVFGEEFTKLQSRGFIEMEEEWIRLTKVGLDMANQVFMEFI